MSVNALVAAGALPTSDRRILCVIDTVGLAGGAERLVISLIPLLWSHGLQVDVAALFSYNEDIGCELEPYGITVHRLDVRRRWSVREAVTKLSRIVKRGQYGVLWGHLYFGNVYSLLCKVLHPRMRHVLTIHSPGYAREPAKRLRTSLSRLGERVLGTVLADRKVAVSKAVADDYAQFFGWSDIDVIHNGIPVGDVRRVGLGADSSVVRRRYGIPVDRFVITVPSRFVKNKGHAVLLRAIAQVSRKSDWQPVLCAPSIGPLRPDMERYAKSLGIAEQVRFLGALPHDELMQLMVASDAVVLPSLREPFGIAAAEAMALGRPVIVSATDGLCELVGTSESAIMVPPGDDARLAEAIWTLGHDADLRRTLGAAGYTHVLNHFDIGFCALKWAKVLLEV